MADGWLDFERPLVEIERQILELRSCSPAETADERRLQELERRAARLRRDLFARLTPWQRVQLARHPRRPYTRDYIGHLAEEFVELCGDRAYAEDPAILAGLARLSGRTVAIIGHQKGRTTRENLRHNFGMPHPEGYRKALRVMRLAEKFGHPVLCFVDTPGAYPGIGAEERGQAEAIARNIREMSALRVPSLVFITGEGGSGGALAIAVGDRVYMLEYAFYSVISPEGCASILWRSRERAADAAAALKFTAPDLLALGVIDEIVPEPPGGAHRDARAMAARMGEIITRELSALEALSPQERLTQRQARFLNLGAFAEPAGDPPRSV
ncbi:MAG: acetyl-CoA carboxylase carboxyltransferase subunit alpha [Candidatus Eisenbacteria bacterium]|nr:acetyl-CoA carboxylase carboxyltransferase subunit alpha [Candidatus Eisenbacteria bacterium]